MYCTAFFQRTIFPSRLFYTENIAPLQLCMLRGICCTVTLGYHCHSGETMTERGKRKDSQVPPPDSYESLGGEASRQIDYLKDEEEKIILQTEGGSVA